eukprot:999042-Alexandrium_andersonii.AAC.1
MNFEDMLALRLRFRQRATRRSGAETKRATIWPQVPPERRHHEVMITGAGRDMGVSRNRQVRRSNDGINGSRRALVAPRCRHGK